MLHSIRDDALDRHCNVSDRKATRVSQDINRRFRERLARRDALLLPGAANALAARVIADLGFEAVYLSGAGLSNTYLGLPDLGFIGLSEVAQHTATIRDATDLPIVVDADTGFGNALNVRHTVRTLERAGASAIQIEDQVSPKRCGHFAGKDVIAAEEMAAKVKAAVDARSDPNLLIVARTDARATLGFDAAIERARMYVEAGADVTFVEAPESLEEIRDIPRRLAEPSSSTWWWAAGRRSSAGESWRRWATPWCSTPTPRSRAPSTGCRRRSGCSRRAGGSTRPRRSRASASASASSASRSTTNWKGPTPRASPRRAGP
jgi:2-methylisocitrate lyase-like PEP mutase family enzyme